MVEIAVSGDEVLTGEWRLDPTHSRVGFAARHAMVTVVHGRFSDVSGVVMADDADPSASSVEVTIAAGSIDTGNPSRDEHLRSGDFLDVETHPAITFRSDRVVRKSSGDEYQIEGPLTIRGTSRTITFDAQFLGLVTDHRGNRRMGFEARCAISRKDWGLTWNVAFEAGGVLVSDKITIELDVSLIETTAEQA